ncbi:hypothetical protein V2S66_02070 [Streptomyces sp. V4-01]|uniref:AMIN-like domain-containing protein n=1 Tax=Actinacidiphila polyblastidii TaxID=3110430 RepID=A0ABU7P4M4_9ACTN|nr:hypothetical protein [Streptomyces sp. V4-01]
MSARSALSLPARLTRTAAASRLRSAAVAAALATVALAGLGAAPAQAASTPCQSGDHCILDARTGAHPDYDRVVFDLSDGTLPGLTAVPSADGAFFPPRGDEEFPSIPGSSYLMLTFTPSVAYTYTTPIEDVVNLPSLKGVELLYSAEGDTEFALALGSHSTYQLSHLTAPNRLIVDIYH